MNETKIDFTNQTITRPLPIPLYFDGARFKVIGNYEHPSYYCYDLDEAFHYMEKIHGSNLQITFRRVYDLDKP